VAVSARQSETNPVLRYQDHVLGRQAIKVQPGGYYASATGELIVTTLGSCVAACLIDRQAGVAGMNHFMLPEGGHTATTQTGVSAAARYGDFAMEALINRMMKLGALKSRMEGRMFGGASVIRSMMNIGQQNINYVRYFMDMEKMEITAEDVGGTQPRKVYFFSETGAIRVKKFRSLHNDTIEQRERNYLDELNRGDIAGEVELF
jgi:chemotaxis protein CheD